MEFELVVVGGREEVAEWVYIVGLGDMHICDMDMIAHEE